MKKKIVICSSVKFRDLIRKTVSELDKLGFEPIFPNLDIEPGNCDIAITVNAKLKLAQEHYQAINNADAVYFILPDGYMGTSCKIELGYALATAKPIYFSEPTNSIDLDCYPRKIISLDKLALLKSEKL